MTHDDPNMGLDTFNLTGLANMITSCLHVAQWCQEDPRFGMEALLDPSNVFFAGTCYHCIDVLM